MACQAGVLFVPPNASPGTLFLDAARNKRHLSAATRRVLQQEIGFRTGMDAEGHERTGGHWSASVATPRSNPRILP